MNGSSVYQGATEPTGSFKPAPVRPEQGMNLRSFAGLNPTFSSMVSNYLCNNCTFLHPI